MEILARLYIRVHESLAHLGKGQTMTEYSLILGAVAVVVFVSYEAMGDHIIAKILRVADLIEDAT
jgi:Flp pilus assembly pilin Flp